jgi:ABC-type transport system involved in multi-copper enzyme maturation permease subunit
MSHALTIAGREMRAYRFVFVAAAAFALIPFVALLPGVSHGVDGIALFAPIVAGGFTAGLAVILGSTMIGRELSERRLSFYFSQPVSASAIWFGKLTSAILTMVAGAAIVLIPSTLVAGSAFRQFWPNAGVFAAALVGLAVLLLLLSHAFSTMVRSRSAWIAVDFICAGAFVLGLLAAVRPLLLHGALTLVQYIASAVAVALPVALIAAGAWQLSRGRTDRVRSHRQFSLLLWTALAAVLLVLGLYCAWLVSTGPGDLRKPYAEDSAHGGWLFLMGYAKHRGDYGTSFLYHLADGRYLPDFNRGIRGAISQDGSVALTSAPVSEIALLQAWRAGEPSFAAKTPWEVKLSRLDRDPIATIKTGLLISGLFNDIAVSNGGTRIGLMRGGIVSVYDVATHHTVGSVRVPLAEPWFAKIRFVNDDVLRILSPERPRTPRTAPVNAEVSSAWTINVLDSDAPRHSLHRIASIDTIARYVSVAESADGSELLIRNSVGNWSGPGTAVPLMLAELGGSGRIIKVLPAHGGSVAAGMLLPDGRMAAIEIVNGRIFLRIFGSDGTPQHETDLGAGQAARFSGLSGGKIVLGTNANSQEGGNSGREWTLHVVDSGSGAVTSTIPKLAPIPRMPTGALARPEDRPFLPFLDESGALVKANVLTGERVSITR